MSKRTDSIQEEKVDVEVIVDSTESKKEIPVKQIEKPVNNKVKKMGLTIYLQQKSVNFYIKALLMSKYEKKIMTFEEWEVALNNLLSKKITS